MSKVYKIKRSSTVIKAKQRDTANYELGIEDGFAGVMRPRSTNIFYLIGWCDGWKEKILCEL
jgi:hypothetical protein